MVSIVIIIVIIIIIIVFIRAYYTFNGRNKGFGKMIH